MDGIEHPNASDILSGRGPAIYNHEGNKRFRKIVEKHTDLYQLLTDKISKSKLVDNIVAIARSSGSRFLKRDLETGLWNDIGQKGAREKVGHSLRDLGERYGDGRKQQFSSFASATNGPEFWNQQSGRYLSFEREQPDMIGSAFCSSSFATQCQQQLEKERHQQQKIEQQTMNLHQQEQFDLTLFCHEVLDLLDSDADSSQQPSHHDCDDDDEQHYPLEKHPFGDDDPSTPRDGKISLADNLLEPLDIEEGAVIPGAPALSPQPTMTTSSNSGIESNTLVENTWSMGKIVPHTDDSMR